MKYTLYTLSCTHRTESVWSVLRTWTHWYSCKSHTLTLLSAPEDTNTLPVKIIEWKLHKIKNMPSKLPKSIRELFPTNIPDYGTTHEQNSDWLTTYSKKYLSSSIFYKGPLLAVTEHNVTVTCPSSLFSINIYKKSAKEGVFI